MDARYDPEEGNLVIVFTPCDIRDYAVLMELVFEDTWKQGMYVPDFSDDFFKNFFASNKGMMIRFNFAHLEFCATFLEAVYREMLEASEDTFEIEMILDEVVRYCADNSIVH